MEDLPRLPPFKSSLIMLHSLLSDLASSARGAGVWTLLLVSSFIVLQPDRVAVVIHWLEVEWPLLLSEVALGCVDHILACHHIAVEEHVALWAVAPASIAARNEAMLAGIGWVNRIIQGALLGSIVLVYPCHCIPMHMSLLQSKQERN